MTIRAAKTEEIDLRDLERLVPKQPIMRPEIYPKHMKEGVCGFFCPVCCEDLLDEDNDGYNYCPECGQKIKWEMED